uniref:Uncharacterized protein n=1 Tax=Ananas comosus var. bracteatus TaxID=296719 RepID=A0A6V7NLZ0_ANACO|nr:unnamed protein product [Ananas comosus var. bracteatus]
MLCHSHHYSTILDGFFLRPNPNPNNRFLPPAALHFPKPLLSFPTRAIDSTNHSLTLSTDESDRDPDPSPLSRRQNASSTALVLLHSPSPPEASEDDAAAAAVAGGDDDEQEEEIRLKIAEEASLATRRVPRFPGSIDFPRAEPLDPPRELRLVLGGDDRVLKRALEVRRRVAAETLKDAMRAGKLSITYSANLVSKMSDFVDRIVIEAAAKKEVPEFSHLSFNSRAKSYIQHSGVVPLIKWLKHNSMTYPQIGKVISMCTGNLEIIRHITEWLKSIHVKGEFLGAVLVKGGSVLFRSVDALEEIVGYLEDNGVRKDWVGHVVTRCPQVLALSMEELELRARFYLDMGMDERDFGTMVFDYPEC